MSDRRQELVFVAREPFPQDEVGHPVVDDREPLVCILVKSAHLRCPYKIIEAWKSLIGYSLIAISSVCSLVVEHKFDVVAFGSVVDRVNYDAKTYSDRLIVCMVVLGP